MAETVVKIAFDLNAAGQGNFLTLDDPIKGKLDDANYPLAGDVLQDVSQYLRSVSVRRGRSSALDKFEAASVVVALENRARLFDPTAGTAVSPYAPSMKPRKEIVVEFNGQRAFTGQVEDWDLSYELSGDSVAVAKASDGFTLLSQQFISPHTSTAQASGARVEAILDRSEVAWPAARRQIDPGDATLIADPIGGTVNPQPVNALAYLQGVERDEFGALFISKDGLLTFRQRTDLQLATTTVFADDGTGIPFSGIGIEYGTEQLRNSVSIGLYNAGTVTADNVTSQQEYGITGYEVRDSLLSTTSQAQDLADWLVGLYGEPQLRIVTVDVVLNGLSVAQQNEVLGLELGDVVSVVFTPNGIGAPIERTVSVDAIRHEVSPVSHRVSFDLSQTVAGFTLDSTAFGVLDSNVLGF